MLLGFIVFVVLVLVGSKGKRPSGGLLVPQARVAAIGLRHKSEKVASFGSRPFVYVFFGKNYQL